MTWTCAICNALAAPGNANLPDGKTVVHRGECETAWHRLTPERQAELIKDAS